MQPGRIKVPDAAGLEAWIADREDHCGPLAKEAFVTWAPQFKGKKAKVAVVVFHGWSASPEELEPFQTDLAKALSANLYCHRLSGHGYMPKERGYEGLLHEGTMENLVRDAACGFKIGTRLGEQLILVACSTGASLVTLLLTQPWAKAHVAGAVLVSPAYGLAAKPYPVMKHVFHNLPKWLAVPLLTKIVGSERHLDGLNDDHRLYWTLRYPSRCLLEIFELYYQVEYNIDYAEIEAPVLAFASTNDDVVSFDACGQALAKMTSSQCTRRIDWSRSKARHTIISRIFNDPETDTAAVEMAVGFLAGAHGGEFWNY